MAGRYVVPALALPVNIFTAGTYPGVPRVTLPGAGNGGNLTFDPNIAYSYMILKVACLVDVRDSYNAGGADIIEVPAGSGRIYTAVIVDDIGKGFPNQHRFVVLKKTGTWPTPIP